MNEKIFSKKYRLEKTTQAQDVAEPYRSTLTTWDRDQKYHQAIIM